MTFLSLWLSKLPYFIFPIERKLFMNIYKVSNYNFTFCFFMCLLVGLYNSNVCTAEGLSMQDQLASISKSLEADDQKTALIEMIGVSDYLNGQSFSPEQRSSYIIQLSLQPIDIDQLELLFNSDSYEIGRAHVFFGTRLFLTGNNETGESHLTKAVPILKKYKEAYRAYTWLGLLYGQTERPNDAIASFSQALVSVKEKYSDNDPEGNKIMVPILSNLQFLFIGTENYHKAKLNNQTAMKLALESDNPYYIMLSHINQATLSFALQDPDNMLESLNKAEVYLDEYPSLQMNFDNLMANAYMISEDYNEAKKYFYNSISSLSTNTANQSSLWVNLSAVADIEYFQKNYDNAIELFDSVINHYQKNPDRYSAALTDVYGGRARVFLATNQVDKAHADLKAALANKGELITWYIIPSSILTGVYLGKYKQTNDPAYADSVRWNIKRTDEYIDSVRREHRYFESEVTLNASLFVAYGLHLDHLHSLYEIDKTLVDPAQVFQYFEKIKSFSLKEYLKTDDAFFAGLLPEEILADEKAYKRKLARMKTAYYQLQKNKADNEALITSGEEINALENEYASFLKEVEENHPSYFSYQYQQYDIDLKTVQEQLKESEAIITYYMSSTVIYTFMIHSKGTGFYKTEIDPEWNSNYTGFLNLLAAPEGNTSFTITDSDKQTFNEMSHQLYDDLISKALNDLNNQIQHITIIGDNKLSFLPFEILLTEDNAEVQNFGNMPFLLKEKSISYDASVSNNLINRKRKSESGKVDYLSYVPNYEDQTKQLVYSLESSNKAAELFDGKCLTGADVNLSNIRQNVKAVDILHFAMHGINDQLYPSLSHLELADEELGHLYLGDIYNSNYDVDLVLLSACNTGTGRFLKGEGTQNISRAFHFAGVSSTLMSLWSLPDVQTSKLDFAFLSNIKEGMRKDEALRKAKLDYLSNAPQVYQHPFYWAGFIPTGNMDALNSSRSFPFAALLLLVFGALLILLLLFRKKSL